MSQSRDLSSRVRTRRAVSAATIGAIIEGYDLVIFGTYSALIFPTLFFPEQSPATGVLLAFATYFIGFVARPLGGIIFGHLGDRVGRKPIMIVTLSMVAIGTVGAGLLPTYAQIGLWAAGLLVLCRIIQGVGFGGEWGGGTLLSMESGREARAALLASFPQAGAAIGLAFANLAVLLLQARLAPEVLFDWGWRIPLLASAVLFLVGLYLRLRVEETPVFEEVKARDALVRRPLFEVFRAQRGTLLWAILLRAGSGISVFVFTAFALSYGVEKGVPAPSLLIAIMIAGVLGGVSTPLAGLLADRIGAFRTWRIGAVVMIAFAFAFFTALESSDAGLAVPLLAFALVPYALMFGPEASLISRTFDPAWRYSGSSLAFNIGGIVGGGLAPLLSQTLLLRFGSGIAIAIYIAVGCLVGILASLLLQRTALARDSAIAATLVEPVKAEA
jgi:MFS family permease